MTTNAKRRAAALLPLALAALSLSGCVSREQADAKLAKGCEAGAKAFLPEGFQIKTVKSKKFAESSIGQGYRLVTLSAIESDGWADVDKDYNCIFREDFTFARLGHSAAIYQLNTGDKIIGLEGHSLTGTVEEHSKLTEAVEKAMTE